MAPPRLHPLDRSPRVDTLNHWLATAWDRGYSSYPSLEPNVLREKAGFSGRSQARSDADRHDFDERLDAICTAAEDEAQLNSLGRTMAHGQYKTSSADHRHRPDAQRHYAHSSLACG